MKFSKIAVLALLFATSVLVSGSTVLAKDSSGGIGGRPANPDSNNPRTQSIFIYTLDKNASKTDQVLVSNNSDETQTIDLYAVDGVVTNSGSYTCQQKAESSKGLGEWTKLSQSQVTLTAHENKKIDFTLTIPSSADVGEHNGCLIFQSADDQGEVTGNVRIRTRQGIRMVATVPGALQRDVTVGSFTTSQKSGLQQFELKINNKGNVSADVDAQVAVRNLFGQDVYKNGGVYPVLSNKQLSLNFVNEKQPFFGGWYTASASITYDTRAGTFGTDNKAFLATKHADDILIFITPNPLAFLIYALVLGVMGGVITFLIVRRRQQANAKAAWKSSVIKKGDTIENLALAHNVSWKKLATINKLKPPYTLVPGDRIQLPASETHVDTPTSSKDI